ncbi:hypothetical protein BAE30_04340 [Acidithiobacillus caldus]|uniref:Cytochrome B6 n=1 Tax=Acidithiobacillus caldus TaxID=33059 RepID=A0A1E7YYQ3_9PROT|nr:hypothetical protein BAE30_04340 [Acidithiobacillus caldus]
MSVISDKNLHGIPMKPYDMVREGLFVFGGVLVVVVVLAVFWGFPGKKYGPLTIQEVAEKAPVAFLQRTASYFSGTSRLQTYGPPYTDNYNHAQHIGPFCPNCWVGVIYPLNAKVDFVMQPLEQIAALNPVISKYLDTYRSADKRQRAEWDRAYLSALHHAKVVAGKVVLPKGDFGPVPVLMNAMLSFARTGLLEAALTYNTDPSMAPYVTNYTWPLLYLGGPIMNTVAGHFDEKGGEWGMSHMAGPYPGAWWLWPYTFLYQIPAIGNSPNGDLIAFVIFVVMLFTAILLPVIPGLRRIPYVIPIYKIIWRDWYAKYPTGDSSKPARRES